MKNDGSLPLQTKSRNHRSTEGFEQEREHPARLAGLEVTTKAVEWPVKANGADHVTRQRVIIQLGMPRSNRRAGQEATGGGKDPLRSEAN
ncbi:MAG TPA: hypothetical protein VGV68_04055 [Terriglobia bacterium]|nr:hypothetical protein [Terriglobia bacterium]